MARIFIDVNQDGTFETGTYHGDPVTHAAGQPFGVVTYMTDCLGEVEGFWERYKRHKHGYMVDDEFVAGDWKQWGASCTRKWGAWFERVNADARRARLPSKEEEVDRRIIGMLSRLGAPMLLSVLKNRMRGLPNMQIHASLRRLVDSGTVEEIKYYHQTNQTPVLQFKLVKQLADADV